MPLARRSRRRLPLLQIRHLHHLRRSLHHLLVSVSYAFQTTIILLGDGMITGSLYESKPCRDIDVTGPKKVCSYWKSSWCLFHLPCSCRLLTGPVYSVTSRTQRLMILPSSWAWLILSRHIGFLQCLHRLHRHRHHQCCSQFRKPLTSICFAVICCCSITYS